MAQLIGQRAAWLGGIASLFRFGGPIHASVLLSLYMPAFETASVEKEETYLGGAVMQDGV